MRSTGASLNTSLLLFWQFLLFSLSWGSMSIESDAIASALHCLKNGARVWDAIDVLEQAQAQIALMDEVQEKIAHTRMDELVEMMEKKGEK